MIYLKIKTIIQTIFITLSILKKHYLILKNLNIESIKILMKSRKRDIQTFLVLIKKLFNIKILRLLERNV
jgi:hypothetical protein